MDNNTTALNHKKVSRSQRCPIPTNQRVEEFEKAHACIADIITDPLTGVCYVKCAAGGKEIDISKRYLVDDQVTIDDITFTKNPDIARRWLISGKNVGVYTGIAPKEVVEDNVIILDIDLRDVAPDEEPGFMAPKDVIDRVVGRTLTIETRTGGLQCIFRNAIGATGSPKLRYVDPETGYLKDAGDTRIKHAYALFAGSYVAPDKVTSKVNPDDPLKPVKKALPHADGLYRAIHVCPVIDLTQEFLDEAGLVIGGNKARAPRNIASSDGSVIRKIDPAKAYSSYGRRRFKYNLTAERIEALKANADPDHIRNKDGRTLESISFTNQKVFNLIKPRDNYTSRGVTNDETESAENMALAYEMRKLGFDNPDTIAMAIILYQPREKNYEIRSNGISYLADTVAGAFDLYDLEQSDEFTEDEILAATNAGTEPSHIEIATGRGYSYLYEVAKDDPNVRFETWHEFPPMSPDAADITLWRGDPRAGKSWHASLYLSQHERGNYITHRHEILDGIFSRLVEMTADTTKTIVWMEGKGRCCPYKQGSPGSLSCKTCPLRPTDGDAEDGIPFLEYQREAVNILHRHRAINKTLLMEEEVDYCPYYILKLAEPEANYCLAVAQFISPVNNPDAYSITPRDYLVIDEEPTIDIFYPGYPALYEYHQYGFAEKWDTNHLVRNDIVGQCMDVLKIIKDKNPKRVTSVNKVIREICESIIYLNTELVAFSRLQNKDGKEQDAFVRRVQSKLTTYSDRSAEFKQQVMITFMEHIRDLPYPSEGDPLQYIQPFLYPAPHLLVWQQGSHPNSPKRILYLMSDHTPMFTPDFKKLLVIGATESEVFVDQIRKHMTVCRVDLETFPFAENYLILVAVGDRPAQQDRIVEQMMATMLERNKLALKSEKPVTPFAAVTGTKEKQQALLNRMLPHGKIIGLNEHDTREDVVRYYHQGYPVAFYQNGTIARGVDLPEYDILFFVDGGFATPRFTALERAAVAASDDQHIKRYRIIRASKVADESTNAAYRTAPLYNRKRDSAKILVIAHHNLKLVYEDIYKHSLVIPVEKGDIDKYTDLMRLVASSVTIRGNQMAISEDCDGNPTYRPIDWPDRQSGYASMPRSPVGAQIGREKNPSTYYIYDEGKNNQKFELVSVVNPGFDRVNLHEIAKETLYTTFSVSRDRRTQKTYEMVVQSVVRTLKSFRTRVSISYLVDRLWGYKSIRARKISRKVLNQMIDDMVAEGILVCDEVVTPEGWLDSDKKVEVKRMVNLNPNSIVVRKLEDV